MRMKKLEDVWEPRIYSLRGYSGVCDGCGTEVHLNRDVLGLKYINTVGGAEIFLPLSTLVCPNCRRPFTFIRRWASLNITEELKALVHYV